MNTDGEVMSYGVFQEKPVGEIRRMPQKQTLDHDLPQVLKLHPEEHATTYESAH